jgi:P pilus assembly chaperone PapD
MQKYQGIKGDEVIETLTFASQGTTSAAQAFAAATANGQPMKLKVTNPSTSVIHVQQGDSTATTTSTTASKVVAPTSVQYFRFGSGSAVALRTASGTASTSIYVEAVL